MRRRRGNHHFNHERWLISYADFITLLFAFFVVLYATSKADQRKQAEAAAAINSAFRSLGLFQSTVPVKDAQPYLAASPDVAAAPMNAVMGDQMLASSQVNEDFERIKRELEGRLSNQIAQHVVALRIGREGLIISLREAGFYDSGSATPRSASMVTLDQIAKALRATPYDVRIEGHTDNVPIHTGQFDSNWELSTARATHLARIFIVGHHFAPARLSASGYAEYHPATTNATEEGRAQNRRVDIIVLPRITVLQSPAVHIPTTRPAASTAAIPAPTATAKAAATPLPLVSQ